MPRSVSSLKSPSFQIQGSLTRLLSLLTAVQQAALLMTGPSYMATRLFLYIRPSMTRESDRTQVPVKDICGWHVGLVPRHPTNM
jgi:hypothetical protein